MYLAVNIGKKALFTNRLKLKAWPNRYQSWLILILALGIFATASLAGITKSSIWHDEGYTMMLAPQSPSQILARTARDVHPPGHYLALHYWTKVFGESELAARSLSLVFILATLVVMFYLVRRLFGEPSARLAVVFLSLAPFLVRYSQEARMYAMVAFLLALATLKLVKAVQEERPKDWLFYSLIMAAAFYTHYYTVFMVMVHWIYILALTSWRQDEQRGLKNPWWWGANSLIVLLFLPWVPAAFAQFQRVQTAFWIPQVTVATIPGTIGQFLTFTDLGVLPLLARLSVVVVLGLAIILAFRRNPTKRSAFVLLTAYAFWGLISVFLLSFKRPIYVDRYFVFAAAAFYPLLAVLHFNIWPKPSQAKLRIGAALILCLTFLLGIRNVYTQSDHQMRTVARIVNQKFQPGDQVVAGELYTFFDFSYYNQTDDSLKLLAPSGVSGYGETSLIYDRADEVVVKDYNDLHPISGYVWVIGKTGPHDYFSNIPANWQPSGLRYQAGYSAAQRYRVN